MRAFGSDVQGRASDPQAPASGPHQARPGRAQLAGLQGPRAWLEVSAGPSPGPEPEDAHTWRSSFPRVA